jgi:UDP-N-acetylglucosamine--N-acetylmuramyl-(pentapeptide) pyrophosphoryl-undecaprenol N-acetylglucosamine transferase
MRKPKSKYRFLFAGGGTGGHLFPAIAVAEKIIELQPEAEVLFVGTRNRIEYRVVPKHGFKIKTIWVSGFSRSFNLRNILFPLKLLVSSIQSLKINMQFKPKVAIGTGAYVSGPAIWGASVLGSKIVLLEQNSYPGLTNRLLEKRADQIHTSFEDSKSYFRDEGKIVNSGNPVRFNIKFRDKKAARKLFALGDKKTILVIGGSLGAKSINEAVKHMLEQFESEDLQMIWQTGPKYFKDYTSLASSKVKIIPFIDNMSAAYSAADLIITRAGATTVAEAAYLGLPVIFVPSPNVAADHQYKNARSLEDAGAAVVIRDNVVNEELFNVIVKTINNEVQLSSMSEKIKEFSNPEAAENIAKSILSMAEEK